jgi:hypothetical protein
MDSLALLTLKNMRHTPRNRIASPVRPIGQVHVGAYLRLKRMILNPDGSVAKETDWTKNLILDGGLDGINTQVWAAATTYCHAGSGTNPFSLDSGTTTASQSGTTVTASAAIFAAGDVGRLIKFDSGEEVYVVTFTDTTHVEVNVSQSVAASEFTIWYVNRTVLQTELKRTNTLRTSGGDNGTTYNAGARTFTHRRTHLFTAEVGAVTYQELGWGFTNVANLFSGVTLSGGGDSLTAGQQYLVISELTLTPTPVVATAQANVGSGGWDSSGNINIESIGSQQTNGRSIFSSLDATGTVFGLNPSCSLEIAFAVGVSDARAMLSDFTLTDPVTTSAVAFVGTTTAANSKTKGTYTNGNFFNDVTYAWNVSTANGDWRGVGIVTGDGRCLTVKFTANQTKDNTHTVTAVFRISWGRVLVN